MRERLAAAAEWAGLANIARVFRHSQYRAYFIGHSLNLIGFWIQRIGVGWLTWELTHSDAWVGIVAFADLAPVVIVGPIAGVLADRLDRRRMAAVTQLVATAQALALAALVFADLINIWLLLALAMVQGINASFFAPVRLSLVPNLVPRESLPPAISLGAAMFNGARFIGPALAAPIIVFAGVAPTFLINAVTSLVFLASLHWIAPQRPRGAARAGGGGLLVDAVVGIGYAARHPAIGPILILLVAGGLFLRPLQELLPPFADDVFGRGATGLAIMTSAMGLGALVAAIGLAAIGERLHLINLVIGAGITAAGLLVAFVFMPVFSLAVAVLTAFAVALTFTGVGGQTLLQQTVPDHMRGRVMSLFGVVARGSPAFGAPIIGFGAELLDRQSPFIAAALIATALFIWGAGRRVRIADAVGGAADPPAPPRRAADPAAVP